MKKIILLLSLFALFGACKSTKIADSHYYEPIYPNIVLDKNTANQNNFDVNSLVGAYSTINKSVTLYLFEESNLTSDEVTQNGVIYSNNFLSGKELKLYTTEDVVYYNGAKINQKVIVDGKYIKKPFFGEITAIGTVKNNSTENIWQEFGQDSTAVTLPFSTKRMIDSDKYYLKILTLADSDDRITLKKNGYSIDRFGNIFVFQNNTKIYFVLDDQNKKWTISESDSKMRLEKILYKKSLENNTEIIIPKSKRIGE